MYIYEVMVNCAQLHAAGVKDAKAAEPALRDGTYTRALRLVMARSGARARARGLRVFMRPRTSAPPARPRPRGRAARFRARLRAPGQAPAARDDRPAGRQ